MKPEVVPSSARLSGDQSPARPEPDQLEARRGFPLLEANPGLIYLDSGATTQKPAAVIEAIERFYRTENANVHRGLYDLAGAASDAYEGARKKVARFLGAANERELIWTRGTTESINLVAQSWGRAHLKAGDIVLLSAMEHHSNLVPWQMLAAERGIELRFIPFNANGELELERLDGLWSERIRLVGLIHGSNVFGTINPVERVAAYAHERGALVLVDAAQTVAHLPIDVAALGADFLAFSGHKLYGPTGIGGLWAREALLEAMPPWQGGGDMILSVRLEKSTWNELPWKFEAGTPDIAGAVGLGAAVDWVESRGRTAIAEQEAWLGAYALKRLEAVEGLTLLGRALRRGPVFSFTMESAHAHDLAQFLAKEGIAVRSGHHCAQPLHRALGIPASARASLAIYNAESDIERLVAALEACRRFFA